jgi:predicted PolB exonuclease-like 3'-5' exonuclease
MSSVIVWDIETVPDLKGFAAANGHAGKSDDEVRAELGDKFTKHIYQSIICIGALVAHREEGGHWIVDALGAPHVGERSEKELIATFVEKIAALSPQLVVRSSRCALPCDGPCSCRTGPSRVSVLPQVHRRRA